MPNLSQIKRQRMLEFLEELKKTHSDDASICAFNEIENHIREKKFGLVFEEHTEAVDEMLQANIPVFCEDSERRICKDKTLPWNYIIEGDNLQALYLLQKTHKGKVDCMLLLLTFLLDPVLLFMQLICSTPKTVGVVAVSWSRIMKFLWRMPRN